MNGQVSGVSGPSAMVVDDDPFTQVALSGMLTHLGASDVRVAGDGRQALRAMAEMKQPPEFVICDVFMPEVDGIELLDELAKRQYRGSVILVSGMSIETLSIARDVAISAGLKVLGAFPKPLPEYLLADLLGLGPRAVAH